MTRVLLTLSVTFTLAMSLRAELPAIFIDLENRHAHATPSRSGRGRTGGGNIVVSKLTPDVVTITMSGAVLAPGHPFKDSSASMTFDIDQEFKIIVNDPKQVKAPKLQVQAQIIGLLRSGEKCKHAQECRSSAVQGEACATIFCGTTSVGSLCLDSHGVGCRDKLSINCQKGPINLSVAPGGCYRLRAKFTIQASRKSTLLPCQAASAEFAPGAIDPALLGQRDAFRGAQKKNYGFRITLHVLPK